MDLPQRKQNRIQGYDYSQNGAYFITICTKDSKCILSNITVGDDAHIVPQLRLTEYGEIVERYIKSIDGIDKYVIMPNHIHMIIFKNGTMRASSPTSISQDIKSLKILGSKHIGHSIWQRSFYDHVIRDDEDYYLKARYIEENPLRWCLKNNLL